MGKKNYKKSKCQMNQKPKPRLFSLNPAASVFKPQEGQPQQLGTDETPSFVKQFSIMTMESRNKLNPVASEFQPRDIHQERKQRVEKELSVEECVSKLSVVSPKNIRPLAFEFSPYEPKFGQVRSVEKTSSDEENTPKHSATNGSTGAVLSAENAFSVLSAQSSQKLNSTTSTPSPSTKFQDFQKLPTELRIRVWKNGLSSVRPRVVQLRYSEKIYHAVSSTPAPALLHVCRESRREAMEVFKLLFKSHCLIPRVYINPAVDTLYVSELEHTEYFKARAKTSDEDPYLDYFPVMFNNIDRVICDSLKKIAVERITFFESVTPLDDKDITPEMLRQGLAFTKFKNLDVAGIVMDTNPDGCKEPAKLVQLMLENCPKHKSGEILGKILYADGFKVHYCCSLCNDPLLSKVLDSCSEDNIDYLYFVEEALESDLGEVKLQCPDWNAPKVKLLALTKA